MEEEETGLAVVVPLQEPGREGRDCQVTARGERWRLEVEDVQVELQGWVEGAKAAMVSKFKNFLLHRGW